MKLLQLNSKGTQVVLLQELLGTPQTGIFNDNTNLAVQLFQKSNNLDVDGKVGNNTWTALKAKEFVADKMKGKLHTMEDLEEISKETGIPIELIRTVIAVESAGSGFNSDTGLIKIQFEPVIFKRDTGLWVSNGVEGQDEEWPAYLEAEMLNPGSAKMATSWGLLQVLGKNFKIAGFKSVYEMVDKCIESEKNQIMAGMNYINSIPHCREGLLEHDWATFAYYYNGKSYARLNYHGKLAEWYKRITEPAGE